MLTEREIETMAAFLTVEEVARILRLKRSTAYEYVRQGIIPCVRLGSFIRIPKARLVEWKKADRQEDGGGMANF
ncbi:helix-turn-helix domain-containing protein [Desulfofundulus thermosubterraneus]|uniref:helix-turn-helix domain-containing protein n=1 Tax=Desulfofundulus thermosubterraneus TaxID=348840 RepID=UPI001F611FF1|nr:helix-turn-helix domain-containing protein [Desulfofundulus thermosubterraneus]